VQCENKINNLTIHSPVQKIV